MLRDYKFLNEAIIKNLTPDLLHKKFKPNKNFLAGHCYVSSEAAYYLYALDLKFRPCFIKHEGLPHWYLRNKNKVIDLTASQFKTPVPYHLGKHIGFLTNKPSKRASILIERVIKCTQLEK